MTNPAPARNRRILVIDDNPTIHEDFRKILEQTQAPDTALEKLTSAFFDDEAGQVKDVGFQVDFASQGREGLDKVQQALAEGRPYALAFVDMRMPPGWDGVETITQLWKADPHLEVVICTAYSDYSWEDIIRKLGNPGNLMVLKKPFDNVEVLQLAETLTQKWHLTWQLRNRPSPSAAPVVPAVK